MSASAVVRNVAASAVGMAVALGAVEARAQAVVQGCEQLLVLGAAEAGLKGPASPFLLGVARHLGPEGWTIRLVLGPSDEGLLCVPGAQAVAAGTATLVGRAGEDVYVRGFGFFTSFTNSPSAGPTPQKPRPRRCADCPKLTRAE